MVFRFMRIWLVLTVGLASASAHAIQTGIGGFTEFSQTLRGNFVAAGASMRRFEGPPQANPFVVTLGGIPGGSTIVKAYANWTYLSNFDDNAFDGGIKINEVDVRGVRSGFGDPDLNWNRRYAISYTQEITGIVTAAGGNGNYTIRNAVDEQATQSLGEGFSLIVVYSNPNEALRQVNVDFGYTSTTSGGGGGEIRFGQGAYQGGETRFFLNAHDGQAGYADDLLVNNIQASFVWPMVAGDSWRGASGPGPVGTNFYDQVFDDSQAFMLPGDTSLSWRTLGGGNADPNLYDDCVGHSAVAISMPVPEPGTASVLLIAGIGWLIRRSIKRDRS